MKVRVRRFKDKAYQAATLLYPKEILPDDFWEEFTGEIIGIDVSTNKIMVCRDDTGKFETVNSFECIKN